MPVPTSANIFSAAPSAIGYLFQIRLALLAVVEQAEKATFDEDQLGVTIEAIDDVAIVQGPTHEFLIQSKSHLDSTKAITDGSDDLWKTLRVWTEASKLPNKSPHLVHCLVTTATAPAGSACACLRSGEQRDVAKAATLLDAAASACRSEALKSAVASWGNLNAAEKLSLVETIQVLDASPNALDLVDQIGRKLFRHKPKPERDEMVARLEGWWYQRVVAHLYAIARDPRSDIILWTEVRLRVDQIMSDFGLDSLPDEFGAADPDVPIDPDNDGRLFVHQLRALNLGKQTIRHAIREHWRASEQRSKWIRDVRLLPEELVRYDKRLCEEWELCADEQCIELDATNLAKARDAGQKVFYQTLAKQIPLRGFCEPYLTRGSYHILANHPPKLGWHPHWSSVCKSWSGSKGTMNESAA